MFVLWAIRQAKSGELLVVWNSLFPPILVFAALVALQVITGRTAYRYETLSSALLYCAYGLLCFLAVQCLRRTSQVKMLAIVVPVYGFAVAMFALIQSMSSNNKLYWLRMPRSGGWIYGPYVNHNHYAGLMEMLAPIPLVFALTRNARGPAPDSGRHRRSYDDRYHFSFRFPGWDGSFRGADGNLGRNFD